MSKAEVIQVQSPEEMRVFSVSDIHTDFKGERERERE